LNRWGLVEKESRNAQWGGGRRGVGCSPFSMLMYQSLVVGEAGKVVPREIRGKISPLNSKLEDGGQRGGLLDELAQFLLPWRTGTKKGGGGEKGKKKGKLLWKKTWRQGRSEQH